MTLCQPPVVPVLILLPPLVPADPIQSAIPHPHLPSVVTSGPPGAGWGQGETKRRDLLPGIQIPEDTRVSGWHPLLSWVCIWCLSSPRHPPPQL